MHNIDLNKYLNIVNDEKNKKGLTTYTPLYPMLRVEDEKLYIGVLLTNSHSNVWSKEEHIKPEYWVLIDINNDTIVQFNKTEDKDFTTEELANKKPQEISKYMAEKTLQYKDYLIKDINAEDLSLQKKLSSMLGNEIEIDGKKVKINDHLLSDFEENINAKINELVDILIQTKYATITIYYDNLFDQIINNYKNNKDIDNTKAKLCIEIMNNYYEGVIGIDNFFNIE